MFYLLRRLFIPYPTAKYLVTPIYLFSLWTWTWRLRQSPLLTPLSHEVILDFILGRSATLLWTSGFITCTALVLVPTPLIEPRYFLIPTILLRIQLASASPTLPSGTEDPDDNGTVSLEEWREYGFNTIVNVATVGLFLVRKFRWEGWEGWMRFMW